jgi:outer membrane protein assembly factor BamD
MADNVGGDHLNFKKRCCVIRLSPLSLVLNLLLSVLFTALVSGCSSSDYDETVDWSPERIYAEAKDNLNNKIYDKAIGLYEKLEGRAAGTVLAQQAQLDKAYAQLKSGEATTAIATLNRFIKINPASPAIDYAIYLKGVANFNDDLGFLSSFIQEDLSERDQKAAKESFESFKELVTRFPNSNYAEDAKLRMRYIVNVLAQSEVNVAQFYYKKGAYIAAINRAQAAINEYRGVPAIREALIILRDSYDHLRLTELREDTQRILVKSFPDTYDQPVGVNAKVKPWWRPW